MAIRITLESFLAVLQRSGLVPKDTLEASLQKFREEGGDVKEGRPFAEYLLAQNLVSRWQAEKLLLGKHKGFFLGRYRLFDLLGKGGMSSVYLAEHTLMRRRCAIKVLPAKWAKTDTSYLGRFHREAQAVAALDHPNIVRAYDVDHETDNETDIHFLVMEYVDGKNLVDIVFERGQLPVREAVDYVRQAALGVGHAHRAGLVHRDIKPGNLLIDANGTVKILDLGLAKFFSGDESSLTVEHDERVLGTADYLAPEQAVDSHSVDSRADIYALGCTLYFLLTGHPPFNEGTLAQRLIAHQTKQPPPIDKDRQDVPADLNAIIHKMTAKDPAQRHQTADELARELEQWLAGGKGGTVPKRAVSGGKSTSTAVPASDAKPTQTTKPMANRKPGASAKPKSTAAGTPAENPNQALAGAPSFGAWAGDDVGDDDDFASPFDVSALDTSIKPSSSVKKRAAAPKEAATRTEAPSKFDPAPLDVTPAIGLKDTQPELKAMPKPAGPEREAAEFALDMGTLPVKQSGKHSTMRHGRRKQQRSLKVPLIIGCALLGMVLLIVLINNFSGMIVIIGGGKGDNDEAVDDSAATDKEGGDETNNSTTAAQDTQPQHTIGEDWHVGQGGDFRTISAALEYLATHVSDQRAITQNIIVAPETYADRIVIDNATRRSIPRGVRIVCQGDEPAVLNPTGPGPVISLDGAESLTIENFEIEAGDRDVSVHIGGYCLGTQLRRLRITGTSKVGIEAVSASGLSGQRIVLDDIRVTTTGTEAIGIRFTSPSPPDVQEIDVVNCRFIGPMKTGIEFGSKVWSVTLRQCIFDKARTAVSITAPASDLQRLVFMNNTFFEYDRAIVFQQNPQGTSRGFVFARNLFVDGTGREIDFEQGFDAQVAANLVASPGYARFNWTERAAPEELSNELDIFAADGRRGADVPFTATTPDTPNYLKPGPELRQAVTEPADGYDFIGAVAP